MGTKHDAEYFRNRRRLQGVPIRDDAYLYAPAAVARGRELLMMEQLPTLEWPQTLYGDATIAELMAGTKTTPVKVVDETLCACGCRERHCNNVSRVINREGHNGLYRTVLWYRNATHKQTHIKGGG